MCEAEELAEAMHGGHNVDCPGTITCYFCCEKTAKKYIEEINKRGTFHAYHVKNNIVKVRKSDDEICE